MFDTNAFDAMLAAGDGERIAAGFAVFTTPIQEDEIRRIADARRRAALLDLLHRLKPQTVAPADLPWDAASDAVIAATAAQHCDLLVTNDRSVTVQAKLRVLTYRDFRAGFLA